MFTFIIEVWIDMNFGTSRTRPAYGPEAKRGLYFKIALVEQIQTLSEASQRPCEG